MNCAAPSWRWRASFVDAIRTGYGDLVAVGHGGNLEAITVAGLVDAHPCGDHHLHDSRALPAAGAETEHTLGSGPVDGGIRRGGRLTPAAVLPRTHRLAERVAQGIYRLCRFPTQRSEDVVVACLWASDDAVASHDTALAIYELTDAMPAAIHVSVPRPFRGRRPGVMVHAAPLGDGERSERDGVPVTTVERTIADVLERSGEELARPAAEQALDRGLVTRRRLHAAFAGQGDLGQSLLDLTVAPT